MVLNVKSHQPFLVDPLQIGQLAQSLILHDHLMQLYGLAVCPPVKCMSQKMHIYQKQ